MSDPDREELSVSGRRSPLIVVVVVALAVALAGWLVSRQQQTTEQPVPSRAPESVLVSPVGPPYASTGPTLAPAAEPCRTSEKSTSSSTSIVEDRVYAGNLSYRAASTFRAPVRSRYPAFASDVLLQSRRYFSNTQLSTPGWTAVLAVGRVGPADGFDGDSPVVARRILACLLAEDVDRSRTAQARVTGTGDFEVDERPGTQLDADVISDNGSGFPGDRISVTVVRDGSAWSFFLVMVPIGSSEADQVAEAARDSVQFG